MSESFYVGLDLTGFENNGIQRPVSRVTLKVDDEHAVTAGDDSGMELLADCPYADQEMVDSVLELVQGCSYKMFSAADVKMDPAAELGDGIAAGGLYSVIARIADDGSGFPSVSAPGQAELEDEFPVSGPVTQAFDRKIAETKSRITKTAELIRLEVERVNGKVTELSASFTVELGKITGNVQDLEGNLSRVEQSVSGIHATVKDVQSGLSQTLRLGADGVTITNANGSKLMIDGGQIKAETLNLSGHIAFSDLDSSTQSTINSAASTAGSAAAAAQNAWNAANSACDTVKGWTYNGTTYIDGKMIASDTIIASKLKGGEVEILDTAGNAAGVMQVEYPSFAARNVGITSGNIFLTAENGYITLISEGSSANAGITLGGSNQSSTRATVLVTGDICPNSGSFDLGRNTAAYRWGNIFLNNAPTVTSDLRVKENVRDDLKAYDAFFDALRPIAYTAKTAGDKQVYLGFGAQDVENALLVSGLETGDFAGLVLPGSEGDLYALRYEQFVPLCVEQIQKLKLRIARLERSGRQ